MRHSGIYSGLLFPDKELEKMKNTSVGGKLSDSSYSLVGQ